MKRYFKLRKRLHKMLRKKANKQNWDRDQRPSANRFAFDQFLRETYEYNSKPIPAILVPVAWCWFLWGFKAATGDIYTHRADIMHAREEATRLQWAHDQAEMNQLRENVAIAQRRLLDEAKDSALLRLKLEDVEQRLTVALGVFKL